MTRILIVTDAWHPQINGVVRSLERTAAELERMGVEVDFLTPQEFRTIPCPSYPEIRLSLTGPGAVARRIRESGADYVHIATEGPLGMLARRAVLKAGGHYTTSYHTRFPEYVSARLPLPESWSYAMLRRFHNSGAGCMVATPSLERDLAERGFRNLRRWSRGVDHELFRPRASDAGQGGNDDGEEAAGLYDHLPGPVFLYVGRVAIEKNIKAFLDLELPGCKVVVGDGPQLETLRRNYPAVTFTGAKTGEALAAHYAAADVFVFPSLTDTFGNVIIEALACGVPVAAFPVMGPLDILEGTDAGVLDTDLRQAALGALSVDRERCRAVALDYTWARSARQFLANVRGAAGETGSQSDDEAQFARAAE